MLAASIVTSIVLLVSVLSVVILDINRDENLEKISLSELDGKLASQEVDKLVVQNESWTSNKAIHIYLKESENGLDKPDNYAIRDDSGIPLDQELTSLEDASHGQAVTIEYGAIDSSFDQIGRIVTWIIPIGAISLIAAAGLAGLYFLLNKKSKKKPKRSE